jgi:DNA polymerase-1
VTGSTVYLIDGNSYIFRAFFALRRLANGAGPPLHAAYGFTLMLLRFLRRYRPGHVGVVFDSAGETFRSRLYPAYKGNRPGAPEGLAAQIPHIRRALEALRVPAVEMAGFEADDLIATLSRRAAELGAGAVVVTSDKDLMQLVSESVRLLDTMKRRWIGVEEVKARFGVEPRAVVEVMGLAGDAVDNIPGVKGVGRKTASRLIQKFHSLENLFSRLDEDLGVRGAGRVRRALVEGRENAFLSRELATARTDVPIQVEPEDLRYEGSGGTSLREICAELGMIELYERSERDPGARGHDPVSRGTVKGKLL